MPTTPPNTTPPGEHVHFPEVVWPESPAPLASHSPRDARPTMEDERLRAATEAALDEIISGIAPRRTSLRRLMPSTAAWFWMAVSAWLAFLLARAEGVL